MGAARATIETLHGLLIDTRLLALYSLQCQEEEEMRLGDQISCGKTALETLRLFTCSKEMDVFLESEQAQFWAKAGRPFYPLTAEECRYLLVVILI